MCGHSHCCPALQLANQLYSLLPFIAIKQEPSEDSAAAAGKGLLVPVPEDKEGDENSDSANAANAKLALQDKARLCSSSKLKQNSTL